MGLVRRLKWGLGGGVTAARLVPQVRFQGPGDAGGGGASGAVPGGGTAGGGAPAAPPPVATPAPQAAPAGGGVPAPSPQPAPSVGGPGGLPGQPAPQPQNPMAWMATLPAAQQAQVQQWQRGAAEAERMRHFAQLGYQTWQQAQQQGGGGGRPQPQPGQGGPAAPPPNPFNVPRFDVSLAQTMLRRNQETGQYEAHANAPPGIVQQWEQYQSALQAAHHSFFQDPRAAIENIVREIAGTVADERTQTYMGRHQQQQFAQTTLDPQGPNGGWLYDRDAAGQVVYDFNYQTGQSRPKLSPWGHEYARRIQELQAAGITDGRMQDQLAIQHLQLLAHQVQARGAAAGAQGVQGQQQFLGGAPAGFAPPGQVQPPGLPPPAAPPTPGAPGSEPSRMTLRARLAANNAANGFNDSNIHQAVMNGFV